MMDHTPKTYHTQKEKDQRDRPNLIHTCINSSDTRSLMNQLTLGHLRFHWSIKGMGKNRDEDEGEGE